MNEYHTFERICWKGNCFREQHGWVRALWTIFDFISYETCALHALEGMKILSERKVDDQLPVVVEWAMTPWPAEFPDYYARMTLPPTHRA